jgi:serine/threonine protein kinase
VTLVGSVLGKYRILSELSTGGMGEVYRAQHEILGRDAAVKVLHPELTEDKSLASRFLNEAKAASAIRHPGIIEVLDFGSTEDGRAYLVMELLEGDTLTTRIAKRGTLSSHEAATMARGIAGALAAAHGKGIVHRDLKPDNVIIVDDPDLPTGERPKVLDFGIAKLADANSRNTQTGALMGTPLYMAPEQARAAATIDHRADLYSLGCILYEMVVGTPPFVGVGTGEIIALQMFETPVPPSEKVESVNPGLEKIILRLLEKEPEKRFQSANEVSDALAQVFLDLSMATPIPSRQTPPTKLSLTVPHDAVEPPRRYALPIVAGLLTVAVAGLAVFFLTRGPKRSSPTSPDSPLAPALAPAPALPALPAPAVPAVPAPAVPAPVPAAPLPSPPVIVVSPKKHPPVRVEAGSAAKAADPTHTDKGSPISPDID